MKKIMSALVAGAMLLGATPALASDINITIDNEEFIPKNALGEVVSPFIENGSTYLPVRAMGEAVGKDVSFDAENYAVYIGVRPMETDVNKTPVLMVEDKVFYENVVESLGIEYILNGERIIKKANRIVAAEEINAAILAREESAEMIAKQTGQDVEAVEYMLYVSVCSDILISNEEFLASVLNNIATVKHILVKEESVAKVILEKIENGANFEDLIEEYNTDPGQTRDSSYTFSYGEMVEEFEKASFELKEGEISKPVKSAFGYHIIKKIPSDMGNVASKAWNSAFLKEVEKLDEGKVVLVQGEGEYGKINSVVYTTDMLKKVNKLFTGEDTLFLYSTAFEYATAVEVLNNLAREKGFGKDSLSEEFNLDSELELFMEIYDAMFGGLITFEDAEVEEAYNKTEIEVFKKIKVFVDGKLIIPCDVNNNYVEPKNIDGTVYVPVRAIVEALGMKADWNNDTRTVVITK